VSASVIHGDCLDVLRGMADASVDAIVTDPPYELGFMGRAWDRTGIAYSVDLWRECLRVLKPGGHLVAFGGTRTAHRMVCAIEDAGFEIRDTLAWLYGQGFPKSLDVSKALDKAAGAERNVVGPYTRPGDGKPYRADAPTQPTGGGSSFASGVRCPIITAPATDAARQWSGWGTALKPAHEPATLARKPLVGTVAANVQTHGTGALNVDGCRVGSESTRRETGSAAIWGGSGRIIGGSDAGRWPANVVLDEDAAAMLDEQSGEPHSHGGRILAHHAGMGFRGGAGSERENPGSRGGASRFFYCAKASRAEREAGLREAGLREAGLRRYGEQGQGPLPQQTPRVETPQRNIHPTVKPVALMRWLCRLVTPPGGTVLDPFAGSGSTLVAAVAEGFRAVGIEREAAYVEIARARVAKAIADRDGQLFKEAAE